MEKRALCTLRDHPATQKTCMNKLSLCDECKHLPHANGSMDITEKNVNMLFLILNVNPTEKIIYRFIQHFIHFVNWIVSFSCLA